MVFLGGTCNESTWRDKLIKMLKVDYFNPVVPDWTPTAQEKERKMRESCTYCLYVITPKMTGLYSIFEVADDSNKRPEKTLFCFLTEDGGKEFDQGQIRSLEQVAAGVLRNGGRTFRNLEDIAEFLNNSEDAKGESKSVFDKILDEHNEHMDV